MNRREFILNSIYASLGGAGLHTALGNMRLLDAAVAGYGPAAFDDYKALVCVFLLGGNDALNTVVPRDGAHYTQYAASRAALALPQSALLPLIPQSGGGASDGGNYGLQSAIRAGDTIGTTGLQGLFNSGQAAILGNVGTLIRPITRAEYQAGSVPVPAHLFSHNDQATYWQSSRVGGPQRLGWGGHIADLLRDANPGGAIPMVSALNSESDFGRGASTDQYVLGPDGPRYYGYLEDNEARRNALLPLMAEGSQVNALERGYASGFNRSREHAILLGTGLEGAPPLSTEFPAGSLGGQLRMVARLISAQAALGLKRQIFFVSLGGFDHHDNLIYGQPPLLAQLSKAMTAFHAATVELGVADKVTAFTASDFGRTLSSNGDGTDHGWGGHHFIVGDAVRGGRFFGTMPDLANGGADDAGWGQIIPTTSVDQYSATLARWFGVAETEIDLIFPNLGDFARRDLGFMA